MMSDERSGGPVRTLVLGIGNPILSDDGVGIHVARMLGDLDLPGVTVDELYASGLELLDAVLGYDRVIIIDAIKTGRVQPGEFMILEEKDFEKAVHGSSPHGINVATALALGRKLCPQRMPKDIVFVAVEAEDLVNVSEHLTDKVASALPLILKKIKNDFLGA
jgi:hydrogenase maturation protease